MLIARAYHRRDGRYRPSGTDVQHNDLRAQRYNIVADCGNLIMDNKRGTKKIWRMCFTLVVLARVKAGSRQGLRKSHRILLCAPAPSTVELLYNLSIL